MAADIIPLGTRLRQRREELGLTQSQAARELDVARSAYRLWEMEAARPAPDRWRAIAQWLGISVTAMLLAAQLLSEQELADAQWALNDAGMSRRQWDEASAAAEGDFFSQERSMIADQLRSGAVSSSQAANLQRILTRIQDVAGPERSSRWHPGHFRKRFPTSEFAPALARAAFTATAVGIPTDVFDAALLLTSELVTNSVKHSGSDHVDVGIVVEEARLRVEVFDGGPQSIRPRTPDDHGGWGLSLVGELATRWGVERQPDGKTIWIEFDLPASTFPRAR